MFKKILLTLWRLLVAKPVKTNWTCIYYQLNVKYNLAKSGVTSELFLSDPVFFNYWLCFYFNNAALLHGRVNVVFFVTNDPKAITEALLADNSRIRL